MPEDNDNRLFRSAVADVRPLRATLRKAQSRPTGNVITRPRPSRQAAKKLFEITDHSIDDLASFRRPGLQRQLLLKLRRGQLPAQAELDLHGYTQTKAELLLHEFISNSLARRLRQVRIIHGKGKGSADGKAVLRTATRAWLQRCSAVLAYTSPPAHHGGSGAVDVLLIRNGEYSR